MNFLRQHAPVLTFDIDFVEVPLYAHHAIPEVWVIDAATRHTHRFRGPRQQGYTEQEVIPLDESLTSLALPGEAKSLVTILPLARNDDA